MAEDEIIKKHTKAVYKAWRNPGKNWKEKAKEIVLEILIIVFAVSLSIWFHSWAESVKDRKDEKEFLDGLKYDIRADLKEMTEDRAVLGRALTGAHYFLKIGAGKDLEKDSLNKYSWIFFLQAQINPRISRFEALKASGRLDIIRDRKLQYNIIDLYQKNFPQIFRSNQYVNSLLADRMDSFIEDNMQLDNNGNITNGQEMFRKSKMRFLLFQAESIRHTMDAYAQGIQKGNAILKQIDEELN